MYINNLSVHHPGRRAESAIVEVADARPSTLQPEMFCMVVSFSVQGLGFRV